MSFFHTHYDEIMCVVVGAGTCLFLWFVVDRD